MAALAAAVAVFVPVGTSAAVGSWSIVATPDAGGSAVASYLEKVACVSATDCWSAGFSNDSSFNLSTLIERWNGTSWSVVSSPQPGTDPQLWSVACASASECWAVGNSTNLPSQNVLVVRWDGSSWTQVSAPGATTQDELSGVTCVSATDCWAVGYQSANAATLIEHWDGTAWTITPSANGGTPQNLLQAVTCVSAGECWAVGSQADTTLIEKWDGTSWTMVTSANNPGAGIAFNDLYDVTCTGANDCWAVGAATDGTSGLSSTLIEHWNGTAWSLSSSPNVPGTGASSSVDGVICMSATNCWAVGTGGGATTATLVEQWNGSAWSIVTSPNPASGTAGSELLGVTCVSGTCWSVGDSQAGTGGDTLAEEYTAAAAPTPTPTPTASPTPGSTPSPTPTASPGPPSISVPSAGAPSGAAPPAVPPLLAGAGAGCVAAALARSRRRR